MENNVTGQPPARGRPGGPPELTTELIIMSSTLNIIISILAFCGNSLVLLSFLKSNKIRRNQTNYFIASLAVADLLCGCITVPLWTVVTVDRFQSSVGPQPLYRVYHALDAFSGIASIMHLMFISLERYFAIVWPILHHVATVTTYVSVMVVIWVLSTTITLISSMVVREHREKMAIFNSVVGFGVPLAVILFSYLSIVVSALRRAHDRHARRLEREMKVAVTVLILIALFIVTWCPLFTTALLLSRCDKPCFPITALLLLKCLQFSGAICNPVVYAARIPDFSKAFSNLLPKKLAVVLLCRVGEQEDSPPTSRDRASSALSVGSHSVRAQRQKMTLLDNKATEVGASRPSQGSIGSQDAAATSCRNESYTTSPLVV